MSLKQAFIGLGANLGDPFTTLKQALAVLGDSPSIQDVTPSRFYSSAPVDAPGPNYVNAVASIKTKLTAQDLLRTLHAIEASFGRERDFRNAPRTLDLDLLLYDDESVDTESLQIPHPRMQHRAFVLRPLQELVGPEFVLLGRPIRAWLSQCEDQPCEPISPSEGN